MRGGPGLTGDRNFETCVEFFKRGDRKRTIRYGVTRDEVLDMLQAAHGTSIDWEDKWVVIERTMRMGLPRSWRLTNILFDAYGARV